MDARQWAAIKRVGCGKEILVQASSELVEKHKQLRSLKQEIDELAAWVYFHTRRSLSRYQTAMRLFRLEDGESHWVVATTAQKAIDHFVSENGYTDAERAEITWKELPPDIGVALRDDDGSLRVQSCADLASMHEGPCTVGSTVW